MTRSLAALRFASLAALFGLLLGADVQCPGESTARPSLAGLQEQIDALDARFADHADRSLNAAYGAFFLPEQQYCVVESSLECSPQTSVLASVPRGAAGTSVPLTFQGFLGSSVGEPIDVLVTNPSDLGLASSGQSIGVEIRTGVAGSVVAEFDLSPGQPVNGGVIPPTFFYRAARMDDGLVALSIYGDPGGIFDPRSVSTESVSAILEAFVRPYAAGALTAELEVELQNFGGQRAGYLVTVADCTGDLRAGNAQFVGLFPRQPVTLVFELATDTALAPGQCTVQVESADGARIYDTVLVDVPDPS